MSLTEDEGRMLRQLLDQATVQGVEDARTLVSLAEKLFPVQGEEEEDDG